jgi:hypothetical protein
MTVTTLNALTDTLVPRLAGIKHSAMWISTAENTRGFIVHELVVQRQSSVDVAH